MNVGVIILIQEIFEHRESPTILTPQIWEPVVGFIFKTVKKLFTNKVSMYLRNVPQTLLQVLVNLLCMSNIQECTELSHIPVSVWPEKLLLWKTEHEHETALKRANKNVSSHN
jgi:mannitol-specific phosphotransferase system IIBC component